jgi:molybdate transport system ATP-binding protein
VAGVIGEYLPFGETTSATLWVNGRQDVELRFSVPTHVAARNGLATGVEARVSLLREGVHLMPYESLERLPVPGTEPSVDRAPARG